MISSVEKIDPEISGILMKELSRQQNTLEMIASENFTSRAVMQAQGTWLTNKYAEGLPKKRYYGGCEFVDDVEQLAIDRAKALFSTEHVNVQPHSGAQANNAVYFALLRPADKVLGMDLSHGGHLTHGSPVNISGSYYQFASYGVSSETEQIDYNALEKKAIDYAPKLIVAGASAYPRIIDFERMGHIAKKAGSLLMVDMAHIAGLVATGYHPNPCQFADIVTTTTHKTLRGPRGGMILCRQEFEKQINKAVFPGTQGGPLMHVIAAKAVALKEAAQPSFKTYQHQVIQNASRLAQSLIQYGYKLVSNGTDNHLLLLDLRNKNQTGKAVEKALDEVGITVNKNTVPFETESPFVTSGIRIGTPALTTRGMKEAQMDGIAELIHLRISNISDEKIAAEIRAKVNALCSEFPLYQEGMY